MAATSRQSPPSPLAIEPAEPGLLEPIPATELTTLATNAADSESEPEAPPTPQPSDNSAATQQQPAAIIPTGPPPALCMGSDDIYWVNQLQSSLTNKGYYCGEEESEDFIFGSDTESAVTTFQVKVCLLVAMLACS